MSELDEWSHLKHCIKSNECVCKSFNRNKASTSALHFYLTCMHNVLISASELKSVRGQPGETHANTGSTCQFHRERNRAEIQSQSRQSNRPSQIGNQSPGRQKFSFFFVTSENCSSFPCYHTGGGNNVEVQGDKHEKTRSQVFVHACSLKHSRQSLKKSVFTLCGFPQQLHQQHSPAPMMRSELSASPKPEMRNDDVKGWWKYLNFTIKTLWLGQCAKTAISSQPNSVFFF